MFLSGTWNTTLALIISCGVILYFYVKYLYSYWQRRGVKGLSPVFPFGDFGKTFRYKACIGEQLQEIYNSTNEPFIGTFGAFRPIFVPRDPELIRTILIKDFQYFSDRGVHYDEKNDPLSAHIFAVDTDLWKPLRAKLTPTFTSGKLKAMFPTIVDCTETLLKEITKSAEETGKFEAREVFACYTTNVISSVAFGLDYDAFTTPNEGFRKVGRDYFASNLKNSLRFAGMFVFPKMMKWLKVRLIDRFIEDYMIAAVRDNLEQREKHNIVRKDFFQLLVQLRNTGNVEKDDVWATKITTDEKLKLLSLEELTAHAFVFFLAGFETSSSATAFTMYEIAKHPEIQKRIQEEIDEVYAKNNGELTYDSLNEMKYLERCIDESLRKYPSLPFLSRQVMKNYRIPGTDIILEKGTAVSIPMLALHHDEKYFPDPDKFDPERFTTENKAKIKPGTYIPFGDGQRNCIGLRQGLLQTKMGIITVLKNFNIALDEQHIGKKLVFSPGVCVLHPSDGIHLKVTKR